MKKTLIIAVAAFVVSVLTAVSLIHTTAELRRDMASISSGIESIRVEISELDARVTALEEAAG